MDLIIIGFGISGIAAAKYAKEHGLNFIVIEKMDSFGGVWLNAPDTTEIQTSKDSYQFPDFPMPKNVPIYPKRNDIIDYLGMYIRLHSLEQYVRYNTVIEHCEFIDMKWKVSTKSEVFSSEVFTSDFIAVCSGYFNHKRALPHEFDGYTGDIISETKLTNTFIRECIGKNALIIGNGASSVDFLKQLKKYGLIGKIKLDMVYRTHKYFINKFIGKDIPVSILISQFFLKILDNIPYFITLIVLSLFCKFKYRYPNDKIKYNNIVSTSLIYDLEESGELYYFKDTILDIQGKTIRFKSGQVRTYDYIINVSGYSKNIDFLNIKCVDTILGVNYILSKDFPQCGFIGFTPSYNWLPVIDAQSRWFIQYIKGNAVVFQHHSNYNSNSNSNSGNDLTYSSLDYYRHLNGETSSVMSHEFKLVSIVISIISLSIIFLQGHNNAIFIISLFSIIGYFYVTTEKDKLQTALVMLFFSIYGIITESFIIRTSGILNYTSPSKDLGFNFPNYLIFIYASWILVIKFLLKKIK
jgi:hypothetical protein